MIGRLPSTPSPILKVFRDFAKGLVERHAAAPCVERRRERAGLSAIGAWEAPLPMMEVNKPYVCLVPDITPLRPIARVGDLGPNETSRSRQGLAGRLSGRGRAARCPTRGGGGEKAPSAVKSCRWPPLSHGGASYGGGFADHHEEVTMPAGSTMISRECPTNRLHQPERLRLGCTARGRSRKAPP